MQSRHGNCKENSSEKPPRNVQKNCYSLPLLQKETRKLKHDLAVLQAAHDEKAMLLAESLLKVDLLEKQNHELTNSSKAAVVANKKKVETKDASTFVTAETKNKSTSTSLVTVDNEIQVKMDTHSVTIDGKNGPTSSSVLDGHSKIGGDDGAKSKILLFDEIVRNIPYDDKSAIIIFDSKLQDQKLSSNMEKYMKKIGGVNTSKEVNNILNSIATKNVLKQFVWEVDAANSFQQLKNILACIYSVVCSEKITQQHVKNIIKNALKNARANKFNA